MKLKQTPEDFKVKELPAIGVLEEGPFALYLLEKKSMETLMLLNYISRQYKIPRNQIGIAGMKDKHAVTAQYVTIPSKYAVPKIQEKNFTLSKIGHAEKQLEHGNLLGNQFEITVRDLNPNEVEHMQQKMPLLQHVGIPNYFDSQRFGSAIKGKFIFREVLKGNIEEAVRIFLTSFSKSENKKLKDEKRLIQKNWSTLDSIPVTHNTLKPVLEAYKKTKSWQKAYLAVPYPLRELFAKSYQSYLWNECVKQVCKKTFSSKQLQPVSYSVGTLFFIRSATPEQMKMLPESFITLGTDCTYGHEELEIIKEVLRTERMDIAQFTKDKMLGYALASFSRPLMIKPEILDLSKPSIDELNDKGRNNRFKVALTFKLPKGSYATMVTKKLFNK